MPWWSVAYLILFAALCCGGLYLDLRLPEPIWYILADTVSAVCSITAILSFWSPALAATLGGFLFVTTGFALIWDCFSLEHDLKSELPDPELSAVENRTIDLIATIAVFLVTLPAYYFGFITAYDHIRTATPTV